MFVWFKPLSARRVQITCSSAAHWLLGGPIACLEGFWEQDDHIGERGRYIHHVLVQPTPAFLQKLYESFRFYWSTLWG